MMLSAVIHIFALTLFPTHLDVIMCLSISQPMIAHVPEFGAFLFHVVVKKTLVVELLVFSGIGG